MQAGNGVMTVKTEVAYPVKVRGKVTVATYAAGWMPNHRLSPNAGYVYEQMIRKHIVPVLGGRGHPGDVPGIRS